MSPTTTEVTLRINPLPRIVGVDISLTATGIASSLGWTRKVGRSNVTKAPLLVRVAQVAELADSIVMHIGTPDLVVIEAPSFGSFTGGGGTLERSALWWKVVERIVGRDIPLAEVAPSQRAKYATGRGQATKSAVVDAVARRWPQFATHGDDNLADAAVLAAMGADHIGHPLCEVPKTHRAALEKVRWPIVRFKTTEDTQ